MKWHKRLSETGDTIIEVMIVLAILGLAFGISTATANRGLQQARAAEEHTQAMGTLNTQVEMLRTALAKKTTLPATGSFCMTSSSGSVATAAGSSSTCLNSQVQTSSFPLASTITLSPDSSYYTLSVTWDGPGTTGKQQELFNYRVYGANGAPGGNLVTNPGGGVVVPPTGGGGGFTISPPAPAVVSVSVMKQLPAAGNTTPACGATSTVPSTNTSVTLTKVGTSTSRTSTSPALFSDQSFISINSSYHAVANVSGLAGGFAYCSSAPASANATPTLSNLTPAVTITIRPMCTQVYSGTTPAYTTYARGGLRTDLGRKYEDNVSDLDPAYGNSGAAFYSYAYSTGSGVWPYIDPSVPTGNSLTGGLFFYEISAQQYWGYLNSRDYPSQTFTTYLNDAGAYHVFRVYDAIPTYHPAVDHYTPTCPS